MPQRFRIINTSSLFIKELLFTVLAGLLITACSEKPNKFSDPVLITIAELQDRRQTDSLIRFLVDKNKDYRAEAALALASVQDTTASLQLGTTLLEDPYVQARKNAAFALGQTRGIASVNALIPALGDSVSEVVYEVLTALGKTISKQELRVLLNHSAKDTTERAGQAWGFYHAALRGVADSLMALKAVTFLKADQPASVRLGAAHFFGRGTKNFVETSITALCLAAQDPDPYVRMTLVQALRRAPGPESLEALKKAVRDADYRVRISAVRALAANPSAEAAQLLLAAFADVNPHVQVAAAEAIPADFKLTDELLEIAKSTDNTRAQATLYKFLLGTSPVLVEEIKAHYTASSSDYQKAALLGALAGNAGTYAFLAEELVKSKTLVIKTAAAQGLTSINKRKEFSPVMKKEFAAIYRDAILDGDAGVIGVIASALSDSTLNYREVITDFSFLQEAKTKLTLPKDIEALQPLNEAIAYFEKKPLPPAPKNEFNHPIDWNLVKRIDRNQKVVVATPHGDIVLRLLVEETPGSVANFADLVSKKYFDGRFVHRVVPNFVMQTGCNRGDGYGSEPYSIRSEFSLRRYAEGSVGMASAGKDTEGTQWFITHSPTPHLDGRYTIFAVVESGMEAVHKIEVGDKILSVLLQDN